MNFRKMSAVFVIAVLAIFSNVTVSYGQDVKVVKGIKGYAGTAGEWGIQEGTMVKPKKGTVLYQIDNGIVLVVRQNKSTPAKMAKYIKEHPKFQKKIFGESYVLYAKKKDKPKVTVFVMCQTKADCNGSCAALVGDDMEFIRCTGNCCKGGVWGKPGEKFDEAITI